MIFATSAKQYNYRIEYRVVHITHRAYILTATQYEYEYYTMSEDSGTKENESDGGPVADATATAATSKNGEEGQHMKPLFEALKENSNATISFAEGFRDKVRILFEHFDVDGDGRLRYNELAALQVATNSSSNNSDDDDGDNPMLSKEMYVMACQSLNCHPDQGLSLESLKFTYAADGADIDADYEKVFDEEGRPRKVVVLLPTTSSSKATNNNKKKEDDNNNDNGEKIYEVGANGVDISS